MMLDGKYLRGLFDHERLKPTIIRRSQGKCLWFGTIKRNDKYRHENVINIKLES